MKIGEREIGPAFEPYVIAEIGVNHDGEVERALTLTDAAADAGADAVKLQYFETDRLMSKAAKLAAYQKAAGETDPIEMLRRLELSLDEMALVVERAHARGIHAIVTVFSVELVDEAETLAWDAYKTASPDIVHRPLLERLKATGKPTIVSTGASEVWEPMDAMEWLQPTKHQMAWLHCVSSYPTPPESATIGGLLRLSTSIECEIYNHAWSVVGYSDHTTDLDTGALVVGIGGLMLEKHLTYDRRASGPDHAASLEPNEFREYVETTKAASKPPFLIPPEEDPYTMFELDPDYYEAQLKTDPRYGTGWKAVLECERDVREVSRQSIVTTRRVAAGEVLARADVTFKRPGTGFLPFQLDEVIGQTVQRAIDADTPIVSEDLAGAAEEVA